MFKKWREDFGRFQYVDAQWGLIWALIFVCFIFLDLFFPDWFGTSMIKYVGIFLCFIYAYTKYSTDIMLTLALLLTFFADTLLVWTNWTIAGVYVFCIAQFMHLLRLAKARPEYIFTWTAVISTILAILVIQGFAPIYAISSVYALILFSNVTLAATRAKEHADDFRARCCLYGFIAFICCDICVATRFLALEGIFRPDILPMVSFLVWLFYYPSQVLIANSSTTPRAPRVVKNLRKK